MRSVGVILAFLLCTTRALAAASATDANSAARGADEWRVDLSASVFTEAWDHNESKEWLAGVIAGIDRRLWRGMAVRGEGLLMRVTQPGSDAWVRGATVGTRVRWTNARWRPVIDVAVGVSDATTAVPVRGTEFNYLAVIGSGLETRIGARVVTVTGRWLHASNNGRAGNHRNPDIQSLGVVLGVSWNNQASREASR